MNPKYFVKILNRRLKEIRFAIRLTVFQECHIPEEQHFTFLRLSFPQTEREATISNELPRLLQEPKCNYCYK